MNILGLARHGLNSFEQIAIMGVMLTAFISLWYAWMLRKVVLKKDKGTAKMQEVWNAIRIGADSYLKTPAEDDPAHHRGPDGGPVPERLRRPGQPRGRGRIRPEERPDHRRHRPDDRLHHGRGVLAPRRPAGHAHGHPGQRPGGLGGPAGLQRSPVHRLLRRDDHRAC